jgi:hypothetical protein
MDDVSERVELPPAFEDVDIDHLAVLVADMLSRLIELNDLIPLLPERLTRFHSRSPPAISVLDYLRRIIKFTNVEKACLVLLLNCIDKICTRHPLFTISSLTCHRFIISSITVCSKGICDSFCSNNLYAKVGGVALPELNLLEREFLHFIDWRLVCTREILQEYYINLVRTHSTGLYTIATSSPELSSEQISPPSADLPQQQPIQTHPWVAQDVIPAASDSEEFEAPGYPSNWSAYPHGSGPMTVATSSFSTIDPNSGDDVSSSQQQTQFTPWPPDNRHLPSYNISKATDNSPAWDIHRHPLHESHKLEGETDPKSHGHVQGHHPTATIEQSMAFADLQSQITMDTRSQRGR